VARQTISTWVFLSFIHNCPGYPIYGSQPTARLDSASDADAVIHAEIARRWEQPDLPTRQLTRTIDTNGTRSHSLAQAIGVLQEIGLLNALE
jgi:hypothetical protein